MPVTAAVSLQGIAIANDVDILKKVTFPIHQQALSLSHAIRSYCKVAECQVTTVVSSEGSTTRRECATHLVGLDICRMRIKHLVIWIVYQHPVT